MQHMPDKKKSLREAGRLTRPPRLEGAVHKRGITPVLKKKRAVPPTAAEGGGRGYTEQQRKGYQLKSSRH